jgi:TIR domain
MVANLLPRNLQGIGPEAADVAEHVLDEEGNVRAFDEIVDRLSSRKWATYAMLEYYMLEALRKPRARGYPPKIFISYRRETPEDVEWTRQLSRQIEILGYKVYLDEVAIGKAPSGIELANFVAKLADTDVAVVVVTNSYLMEEQHENQIRDWIYQEWTRIQALQSWGLLEVVLVVRSASGPTVFFNFEDHLTRLIDIRNSPQDFAPVLQFLEGYSGLSYPDTDRELLAEAAAVSIEQASLGDPVSARASLKRIAKMSDTEEYRLAEVHVLAAESDREAAIARGLALLESRPTLPIAAETARELWLLDADLQTFPYLAEIVEIPSLWRFQAHYMMADILRRNRMPYPAISHFGWCLWNAGDSELDVSRGFRPEGKLKQNIQARLALLWLLVGDLQEYNTHHTNARIEDPALPSLLEDTGLTWEALSLQKDPMATFDIGLRCYFCRGIYYRTGYVCISCGAAYGKPLKDEVGLITTDCAICRQRGTVIPHEKSKFCAVCRIIYNNGIRRQVQLLPHGPRGLYSVLPPGHERIRLYAQLH